MTRRNLVIVRAGDSSLHTTWLGENGRGERNWDLIVKYFGDDPEKYQGGDWLRIASKGRKWTSINELIVKMEETVRKYDFVWLPDDDLACSCEDINRFFEICAEADLQIAQPSLTHNSYFSYLLTLHNACFRLRYTSFVEIMAPCFSTTVLWTLLPTFNEPNTLIGLGLEYLWWNQLAGKANFGIVDEVQVRHTRPVGGSANYDIYKALNTSAWDEFLQFLKNHGIQQRRHVNLSGFPKFSHKRLPAGLRVLVLYAFGLLLAVPWMKLKWYTIPRRWFGAIRDQARG